MQRYLCSAALCVLALSSMPAKAGLNGDYTITIYNGPYHQKTVSECIEFTNTGGVLAFPDSGTWDSPTYSGWGGNFVVEGKILRWYGTYGGGSGATNFFNKIKDDNPGNGGYDEWTVSAPPIAAQGDGVTRFKTGCSAPVSHSSTPLGAR